MRSPRISTRKKRVRSLLRINSIAEQDGGRGKICSRNDLATGDVVQIAENGNVFHSMVVAGAGPVMSYHTTNTLNKDLSLIEAAYSSANEFSFLYWKISDLF
jgi:hypothetical protein